MKHIGKILLALLLCAGMLASFGAPALAERDLVAEAETIEFDPDAYTDILLDVPYLDDGEKYHMVDLYGTQTAESPLPVLVSIHGGAFFGGSRGTNTKHSIFFAERGYAVVNTDYARIPRHGDFKTAVQDLFASYHWIAEHAEEYHLDLNNIFLHGDSAGGFYAILTVAIFSSPELQEYFGVTLPDFTFRACVTTCPVADIMGLREGLEQEEGFAAFTANKIGSDILLNDDLMNHLDLMQNVPAEAFEGLYMMTTPTDDTTGRDVVTFDAYLTEHGVAHTLMVYEGVEKELRHTFNIGDAELPESKVANQDMVDYLNTFIQ